METDVVVVGGGLAGLAAAAFAAKAGARVVLLERAPSMGGRAATHDARGYALNLGPHALYRGGPADAALRDLGVAYHGRAPSASGGFAYHGGALHTLPAGFVSLLSTGLLRLPAKLQAAQLLGRLPSMDAAPFAGRTAASWIAEKVADPMLRRFVEMLLRVATYADAADRIDAEVALTQARQALKPGVLYLDGGWRTLVDGLLAAARAAGAEVRASAEATEVLLDGGAARGVRLADGTRVAARAVIAAGSPQLAHRLAPASASLRAAAEGSIPVEAACLDLALARLPRPRRTVAFGVDRPLYFSVHSAAARLAPDGGAVVHAAKYLRPGGAADAAADLAEIEALVDVVQPGWRDAVVERRYLPRMTVYHRLTLASDGGLAGRPAPSVPDAPGLFVAGDWVGGEGLLADASFASARAAASLAVASLAGDARELARTA